MLKKLATWSLIHKLGTGSQTVTRMMSLFSRSVTSTSLRPHDCSTPSITISQNLLKHMSTESVMPSNHPVLCRPLLLLPSIFPSIRVFSNESALCIRWPKSWSFSFNISPSNIYSGLISFRIDNFDLLAVQGTLPHHSWKASIPWHSASLWPDSHMHAWHWNNHFMTLE